MNSPECSTAQSEDSPPSLPRTSSTADFSKLYSTCRSASHKSKTSNCSRGSSRRSDANASENSQVLYMAETKSRRSRGTRQSLSSISNSSDRRLDGTSDGDEASRAKDQVSWEIIDREIFEWQYVCQTGRPYWWSPESRYTRLKKLQPMRLNESNLRIWTKELDDRPKPAYAAQRRAVSDNYFCDPSAVDDLAHMIAVQLLGACFTLPPGHILSIPSPHHAESDIPAYGALGRPRMISSLRMHTHFRYSPSFGHQARNTSPVQAWPKSSGSASPAAADTPSKQKPRSRRSSWFRNRHTRGGVNGSHSSLSSDGEHGKDSGSKKGGRESSFRAPGNWKGMHEDMQPGYGEGPSSCAYHVVTRRQNVSHSRDHSQDEANVDISAPRDFNYSLQPVLRSEPHHIFIQPVRELVVKRWNKFRRRFGGSMHASLPFRVSEDEESVSASESCASDAKSRRLRAQERGDIHSSSVEESPHYTTPVSGNMSPSASRSNLPDRPRASRQAPDIAVAALAAAESRAATEVPHISIPESASEPSLHSPQHENAGRTPSIPSRPLFPLYTPARAVAAPRSGSFSSRRRPNRERRKSMLSEVCTPDDSDAHDNSSIVYEADERDTLSAPASTQVNSPYFPIMPSISQRNTLQGMPRLQRTSTSGTQVFTPSEEGTELDGLPVGPAQGVLTGHGRRIPSYL